MCRFHTIAGAVNAPRRDPVGERRRDGWRTVLTEATDHRARARRLLRDAPQLNVAMSVQIAV